MVQCWKKSLKFQILIQHTYLLSVNENYKHPHQIASSFFPPFVWYSHLFFSSLCLISSWEHMVLHFHKTSVKVNPSVTVFVVTVKTDCEANSWWVQSTNRTLQEKVRDCAYCRQYKWLLFHLVKAKSLQESSFPSGFWPSQHIPTAPLTLAPITLLLLTGLQAHCPIPHRMCIGSSLAKVLFPDSHTANSHFLQLISLLKFHKN